MEEGDEIKKEISPETSSLFISSSVVNNNGSGGGGLVLTNSLPVNVPSCFLHIKDEPPDPDIPTVPAPVPVPLGRRMDETPSPKTVEVGTSGAIVIKTEVLDSDDKDSVDTECDFEDDEDEDFDLDGFSSGDTPDSGHSKFSSSGKSESPDSVESGGLKIERPKKEEAEPMDVTPGSFEFDGMTIETLGNYSKCPKCKKNIKSTFIIRHIKLHDLPPEKFTCPEEGCSLQVNRINNLFRHLREIHKSKKPYMCKLKECGERFARSQQLKAHAAVHRALIKKSDVRKEKSGNEKYVCEFPGCGKEYKKKHHVKEHERKHTGNMKFKCDVCGKRFYTQAHMKRHLFSHTGIKPHVCRWKCGAIFASYGGRMKHERINHYDNNPLSTECDICGRPFNNQQQLSKHRMTHLNPEERKDHRCSFCNIMFDTIRLREAHEERHKDGEVFKCETCEKDFKNEKNLSHHIKTHHIKNDNEDAEPEKEGKAKPAASKKRKYPPPKHYCHICGPPKQFCLTSLRRHLARIHSTNHKCPREECGKFFQEKSQLDAHVEIHRLRECHLCGKKFQRKQNADIHLLGVHKLSKDDLAKLGRWNPKKDSEKTPEYMTRKTNNCFKNFRRKKNRVGKSLGSINDEDTTDEEEEIDCPEDEPAASKQ